MRFSAQHFYWHHSSRQVATFANEKEKQVLIPPDKTLEVDSELWELLDICNDEELESIHHILYGEPLTQATTSTP